MNGELQIGLFEEEDKAKREKKLKEELKEIERQEKLHKDNELLFKKNTKTPKNNEKPLEKEKPKKKLVKVFGNQVFVASKTATNEEIRVKLVDDFGYSELTKHVTKFKSIPIEGNEEEETLLVVPEISAHEKKG